MIDRKIGFMLFVFVSFYVIIILAFIRIDNGILIKSFRLDLLLDFS